MDEACRYKAIAILPVSIFISLRKIVIKYRLKKIIHFCSSYFSKFNVKCIFLSPKLKRLVIFHQTFSFSRHLLDPFDTFDVMYILYPSSWEHDLNSFIVFAVLIALVLLHTFNCNCFTPLLMIVVAILWCGLQCSAMASLKPLCTVLSP